MYSGSALACWLLNVIRRGPPGPGRSGHKALRMARPQPRPCVPGWTNRSHSMLTAAGPSPISLVAPKPVTEPSRSATSSVPCSSR